MRNPLIDITIREILRSRRAMLSASSAAALAFSVATPAPAVELPQPCVAGVCGPAAPGFVSSGNASATSVGNTLTVNQTSDRALLNWASFNVSADGRVVFNQPNSSSIALNRIFQQSPSRILGTVQANGEIYLINPNGFVFGKTSRIDAAGILASTLSLSEEALTGGLLSPDLLPKGKAALVADHPGQVNVLDASGNAVLGADGKPLKIQLIVEEGAQLNATAKGGRVLLAGQQVTNGGKITANEGQVVLAAGEKVYLQASSDPALRGLLVEVDAGGKAWNQVTGEISTPRGNTTMVGLAVNQEGRISATTTVSANGSIRLLARDTVSVDVSGTPKMNARQGGTLEVGARSSMDITPELADSGTAVDEQVQMASSVEMTARKIALRGGATIRAAGGTLTATAQQIPTTSQQSDPESSILVESGVNIDLSGSDVALPMSRNTVSVELRSNELRDSPDQRDGALRGKTVVVDARVGTQLADIKGALAAIPKGVAERTSNGGTVKLNSEGSVTVDGNARIDVSGGTVSYAAGPVATTQLITADGRLVDIGQADPTTTYVGLLNPTYRRVDDRWGIIEMMQAPGIAHKESGYVQGQSAGTLQFAAPQLSLKGDFLAQTVIGPYQREIARQPAGGRLIIGLPGGLLPDQPELDFRAPSLVVTADVEKLEEETPAVLALNSDYFTKSGFTRAELYSNGTISFDDSAPLALAAGSSIQATARRVDFSTDFHAAGGSLALRSVRTIFDSTSLDTRPGVSVSDGLRIDVSGNWTNDALALSNDPLSRPVSPVALNAGTLEFTSASIGGELGIGNDVSLIANGGAWAKAGGAISSGAGGGITISAGGRDGALEVGDGISLSAFGVNGAKGGRFTLEAQRIELVNGLRWSTSQTLDDSLASAEPTASSYFQIGSGLFDQYGFSNVTLTATGPVLQEGGDALRVAAGTVVSAQVDTVELRAGTLNQSNAESAFELGRLMAPTEVDRQAANITLKVDPRGDEHLPIGGINVEQGAVLSADARSSILLQSVGGVRVDGIVRTAGGSVKLQTKVPGALYDTGYKPELSITVGKTGVIDVAGTALVEPNDADFRFGEVLAGGSINLFAERGSVLLEQGSLLDASGASALLDIATGEANALYSRQAVVSKGGAIELHSPETLSLGGSLRAGGGSLTVDLSRELRHAPSDVAGTFPSAPATILFSSTPAVGVQNGVAFVSTDVVQAAGVGSLTLKTDGELQFRGDIKLAMVERMQLDAPVINLLSGTTVDLTAPYLSLGSSLASDTSAIATGGSGVFTAHADMIDVLGSSVVQGASKTNLLSTGDLRLRGTERADGKSLGNLQVDGTLSIAANRVYPSTATHFLLDAAGEESFIRINPAGASHDAPLSAAGSLKIQAANIEQNGTVMAPFGQIELAATHSVKLGAGSLTSVSAAGQTLLYGHLQNGETWIYDIAGNAIEQTAIPDRTIEISAPSVSLAQGSTIDLKGGGDLYAYEWIPGSGGSTDALDADNAAGYYAILPSLRGQYAPYDPQEYADSSLKPGDSVYLSGFGDLEAGYYPLLPARYALLPGAYLVRSVNGTLDTQPGSKATLANGTPVVAGFLTFGHTGLGENRYSGFALLPGTTGRRLAEYEDNTASKFYAARADRLDLAAPVLPADAGTLSLSPLDSLSANGSVLTAAAEGGRGARIELAASRLEIVNGSVAPGSDAVQIDASVLNEWNPAELLLGGRRLVDGKTVDVIADSVTLTQNAQVSIDDVVLVAAREIALAEGAKLTSPSTGSNSNPAVESQELTLDSADLNGAAVLAVSDSTLHLLNRTAVSADGGRIDIAAGATVGSRGSVVLDAPMGASLNGEFAGSKASWSLGASSIVFGQSVSNADLDVSGSLLTALQNAKAVRFATPGTIDFTTATSLGSAGSPLEEITLAAGGLRNLAPGVATTFAAERIVLEGSSTAPPPPGTPADGTLTLIARQIELDQQSLAVQGFSKTSLEATDAVIGRSKGGLNVAGDLDVRTSMLTAAAGSSANLEATGAVRILGATSNGAPPTEALGGGLRIAGRDIYSEGTISLPSGSLTLSAVNDLTIAGSGRLDASGRWVTAANTTVASSGGAIKLEAGRNLTIANGSVLDVSGAQDRAAGRMDFYAGGVADLAGTLRGSSSGTATQGGSFDLEAGSLTNFSTLNAALQAGAFTNRQAIHVSRGDFTLTANQSARAHEVEWTTDSGRITVAGSITAPSEDARSSIRLFASQGLTLSSSARLNADAASGFDRGGGIELGSTGGTIDLAPGSVISAQGSAETGTLRVRSTIVGDSVNVGRLAANLSGVREVVIEGVKTFTDTDLASIQSQVGAYAPTVSQNVQARFGGGATPLRFEAGVELRANGDLDLGPLNLADWRFDGQPVSFTARATGNVSINGTISDGFKPRGQGLDLLDERSASIRIIAGANLTSVNPDAVVRGAQADLTLGAGSIVRTGTGDLRLGAARDFIFGGSGSSVYTGGRLTPDAPTQGAVPGVPGASYIFPVDGGDIFLTAGQDILGAQVSQGVTSWQLRQGTSEGVVPARATQWSVDLRASRFNWNTATFGGGDLKARAGRDITNLSAATADTAIEIANELTIFGGGALTVQAGEDIGSGMFYVAQRAGDFTAGGAINSARTSEEGEDLGSVFALGNASLSLVARNGILTEGIFNPTVLTQPFAPSVLSYFFTYGEQSAISAESAAGDIELNVDSNRLKNFMGTAAEGGANVSGLSIMPSSVSLRALTGDTVYNDGLGMFASNSGQLEIFAGRDVVGNSVLLSMSDAVANTIPAALAPERSQQATVDSVLLKPFAGLRHQDDLTPVSITAGRDISRVVLELPKAAELSAGRDIWNISLFGQNLRSEDVTLLSAGRDLFFSSVDGAKSQSISIGGPGRVDVLAGREVDLGFSQGIVTTGQLSNPSLPAQGADLTVFAGLGADPDFIQFVDKVIAPSSDLQAQLVTFIRQRTGKTLSFEDAAVAFKALDPSIQRPLIVNMFFSELVLSGREANSVAGAGFDRGYKAIDALFPDSRPPESGTPPSPFDGDLSLSFSRIYTLGGGDISLLVPGGFVNVGLANPPPDIAQRAASELGIVAQREGSVRIFASDDVLVNQSRVFTLLGGDIAVWSTTGDIDAGRGAKSAISAPPPAVLVDPQGKVTLDFAGAVAGSGIRTIVTNEEVDPGDVDLIAPSGTVNAGDAGIGSAGNLNIAAQQVVGLDNIQVGGISTGVPAEASGLGASLAGVTNVASSSSNAAGSAVEEKTSRDNSAAPLAESAISWLDVFVEGFGEESCKANDAECLKRNPKE